MSEAQMESARAVNPADRQESALHSEIYSPTTQWASFERLNAGSNERNPNFLDMSASDPYGMENSSAKAPNVGDPKRLDFRQERQQNAIFDGIKSGEIDFDEFTDLEREQDLIAQVQEYFGADGLSKQEMQNLDLLQNSARQHIIDAGGSDELKYQNEDEEETGSEEKPEEHGGEDKPEEHGGEEKPEEHGGEEKPEEQPGGEAEKFQQFMNFLDQNGDAQISLEELLQAFQAIDENQDGVISPEELQKFMEKFAEKSKQGEKEAGGEEPSGEEEAGGEGSGEEKSGGEETVDEPKSHDSSSEPHETEEPSDSTNDGSDQPDATNGRYPDAEQMKMIYIFPNSQQEWQKLNQDAPEGSMIVTLPSKDVSWDSDKPFNSMDPALQRNIAEASANGLNPMGYVGTRGGTRPIEEVKAEIDSWYKNSDVKGIYLGDSGNHQTNGGYATDPATEAYFQDLGDYIHAKGGIAAVNGAGTPNQDYAGKFVQGVVEGNPANMPAEREWQSEHPPSQFAAMLVGVQQEDIAAAVQKARENHNGYVFVQSDWGKAPTADNTYWNEVIRSLKGA